MESFFEKSATFPVARGINPQKHIPKNYFDRLVDKLPDNPPGGAGGGLTLPLLLIQADSANVFVIFGQVSGITPTGVATNIDVSGTDATWSIYLHATLDTDGNVTAVEILSGTSGVPTNDTDDAYILIGEADVASGAITVVRPSLMFSQSFAVCGRDPDDPDTTPGIYYFFVA